MAVRYASFQELNVEVLSISVDSVYVHQVWNQMELSKMVEGGIPFPMLTDPAGAIGRQYDVYDEKAAIDIRGRFLIDPEGKVQSQEALTASVGRSPDELIRQIKAFQHNVTTCEVIPSGWVEGEKTLQDKPELAGKIWEQWKPSK